jgi:LysM repeat protein
MAQQKTHIVKQGETVSGIAQMMNARVQSILTANGIKANTNLVAGQVLKVPNATVFTDAHYTVRNGDCDWTIARKFDTTVHKLHLANPNIENWDALRNGVKLVVPGQSATPSVVAHHKPVKPVHHSSTRSFVVTGDDNDWVIAHHLGVPLKLIHELNPGVDWRRLGPGKHIIVPGNDGGEGSLVAKAERTGRTKINRIKSRYAVVNSDSVSIRREAGAHARKITTVDTGTRVVVLDRDGAWYKLRFPRGTEGWVRGDFLNPSHGPATRRHRSEEDSSETRVASRRTRRHRNSGGTLVALEGDAKANPILKGAYAMRGTPYSYGSSSRSSTDCSGFTWQVYGKNGVHLPRTSREQSEVGQPVKTNELKPGDLVFFGSRQGRGVHHVGIYVGKGKFIHASSGGGKVQFNSLSDDYYHNHYKGARRVVKLAKPKHAVAKHESHESQTSASSDTNATPLGK